MVTIQESAGRLFRLLADAMSADAEFAQRAAAHVRVETGHNTVMAYAMNGASDEDKLKMYAFLVGAYQKKRWDLLKGGVPNGQAKAAPVVIDVEPVENKPTVPVERPAVVPRVNVPVPSEDAAQRLLETLRAAVVGVPASVDEGKVLELIAAHAEGFEKQLRADLEKRLDEYLAKVPAREVLEVRTPAGTVEVEGLFHWQLPQVISWVSSNVPLWLWGSAGGGKTTMARQVAKALNLTPQIISVDPTMTVGKLLGFRNLATGEFVEGLLYGPYKSGGLVLLDEIDTGDAGIIASLNALLANDHYLFPNGETVARHSSFRVIAGANTKGCGAVAGYTARQRLDAATLDRFAVIELAYDAELERSIALGEPKRPGPTWEAVNNPAETATRWVDYVQKVRGTIGSSALISPRASILGVKALRAGVPAMEVAEALVFKLVGDSTRANIVNHCGRFE